MRSRCLFWIVSSLFFASLTVSYHATPRERPQVSTTAIPVSAQVQFLNRYCTTCHNEKTKTAGLALDTINVQSVEENMAAWERVDRKLVARTMPPAGRLRPSDNEYDAFVSDLEKSLDRIAESKPDPGRTATFHRLNRTEYANAVRDLLALTIEDVDSLLPKDEESHGFDNVNVAGLPPALLERYVATAQKISERAIGSVKRLPGPTIVELRPDLTQEQDLEGMPLGSRGGTVLRHVFPVDAEYEIEIRLSRDRDENVEGLTEPHQMEISIDGERVQLITVKPGESSGENSYYQRPDHGVFNFRTPVNAGPHDIAVTFLARPSVLSEQDREPFLASFNIYRHPRLQPAIYRVAIAGPFNAKGPGQTPSRQRIFSCQPATDSEELSCARTILATLARRAYRRPTTDEDMDVLLRFYTDGHGQGGFESGIESGLAGILVSPEFLFRIEKDPPELASNTAYRISELELASRLSFFLWSSIPDDELLQAAEDHRLGDPKVLEQQVRRMLADPRAKTLVTNFAAQWLQLRNLAAVNRSPRLFPDFDDNLRQAFRRETELFVQSIIDEDRSVLDLLSANYTFLNERLARHYGIPNVYGSRFRRVTLDKTSARGGLLGQGSFLAVTSYETRTAPTLRGKWILENVLGSPPPPAPPNIPALQDRGTGNVLSMRERMAQHRDNASCASCHQLMDPLGFSLEHFDAVGSWRNREDGAPIDASGAFPDGQKIDGIAELKNALLNRPQPFLRTFTEKLLTYAVGRSLDYHDAPAVRKIVAEARMDNDRLSAIVLGIVRSTPFQMRKTQ